MTTPIRRRPMALVVGGALMVTVTGATFGPQPAVALTCGGHPDDAAVVLITSGYPPAAPFEHAVIATVQEIRPVQGDAFTWGAILVVRIDASLRGGLPLDTREIYNPPLGLSGWTEFVEGGQFLVAASPAEADGVGPVIATFLCAPNERISSPARFWELVGHAANPMLPATNLPPPTSTTTTFAAGLALLGLAVALGARRAA